MGWIQRNKRVTREEEAWLRLAGLFHRHIPYKGWPIGMKTPGFTVEITTQGETVTWVWEEKGGVI